MKEYLIVGKIFTSNDITTFEAFDQFISDRTNATDCGVIRIAEIDDECSVVQEIAEINIEIPESDDQEVLKKLLREREKRIYNGVKDAWNHILRDNIVTEPLTKLPNHADLLQSIPKMITLNRSTTRGQAGNLESSFIIQTKQDGDVADYVIFREVEYRD